VTHDDEMRQWFERHLDGLRRIGVRVNVCWAGDRAPEASC
jgi:hypothetical protein